MSDELLNIGCGPIFHPEWVNIDLISTSPYVQSYDIRKGLPFPDAYFKGCYSSHLVEHLARDEACRLLAEISRVLKPGGVVRVVVPDLEMIARIYIATLEQVESGSVELESNYDWIVLELYDQMVRHFSGGEMGRYLAKSTLNNKDFVLSRMGAVATNHWTGNNPVQVSIWTKLKSYSLSRFIQQSRIAVAKQIVRLIAGNQAGRSFEEGLFRNSGEIHRWMYDRFSLRRLLEQAGFVEVGVCQADESRILNFNYYNLDVINGQIRKPDSLFMEGIKPELLPGA